MHITNIVYTIPFDQYAPLYGGEYQTKELVEIADELFGAIRASYPYAFLSITIDHSEYTPVDFHVEGRATTYEQWCDVYDYVRDDIEGALAEIMSRYRIHWCLDCDNETYFPIGKGWKDDPDRGGWVCPDCDDKRDVG